MMMTQPMLARRDAPTPPHPLAAGGLSLLDHVELMRRDALNALDQQAKTALGQFFTPAPVASLMASMLECDEPAIHILDAGAGIGALFAAAVEELCGRQQPPAHIRVTAYEIDSRLAARCRDTLRLCELACARAGIRFDGAVVEADFIESAVSLLRGNLFMPDERRSDFTCAILNPPYHKIASASRHRMLLRQIGVETTNLYAGFLAAAVQLLAPNGELVAITPRSFCNGPYFRPFREAFLKTMSLRRLHVFDSRTAAFREDEVLQENVILSARKGPPTSRTIAIAASTDGGDDLIATREVPYEQVIHPSDPQSFIRIVPDELGQQFTDRMAGLTCSLEQLGLSVSTGRVVDFRAREFLRQQPAPDTAPLIYPTHLVQGYVAWPKPDSRKPNALYACERTQSLLVPNEHYVLVKRFSAKEEKRRIVAAVYDAGRIACDTVGFENHLNYVHQHGRGLSLALARGLAVFLNSTLVDTYFRQFNGHTQVNATDLRTIRYPTLEQLERMGARVGVAFPDQNTVDRLVREEIDGMAEGRGADPTQAKQRIDEALAILKALGFPRQQQNDRSALTLLALLDLTPDMPWSAASNPLRGIKPMMEYFAQYYGKTYKENTRESVRRRTVHQFLAAALITINPDKPDRATNSDQTVYQIESTALGLMRAYDTSEWESSLIAYLAGASERRQRYAQERLMSRIPVQVAAGTNILLSPGGQNPLIRLIIEEFGALFTPGGTLLYVGDTAEKFSYFDRDSLMKLGVEIKPHGKMPDVLIHDTERNRLIIVEAVTSHGPIDQQRKDHLDELFADADASLIFVTAFADRRAMARHLSKIAWETEVWTAESPMHLIHFNGEKFLGSSEEA